MGKWSGKQLPFDSRTGLSRPVSQWLTPRVSFAVPGGISYPLVFTHRALLICEDLTGVDMLSATLENPSSRFLRALLYAALHVAGAPTTLADAGKLFTRSMEDAHSQLIKAWAASMPDPEKRRTASHDSDGLPEPKRATWESAWAIALTDLNLTEDQWLDSTPRMIAALRKAWIKKQQRHELLFGIVTATIENFSMNPPKKAAVGTDFMLHPFDDLPGDIVKQQEVEGVTGESIMSQLRSGGWTKAREALNRQTSNPLYQEAMGIHVH